MNEVESFEVNGLNVRIVIDEDPESPRERDNLGTMVCWHRRYNLGDKHSFGDHNDFFASLLPDGVYEKLDACWDRECDKAWTDLKTAGHSYGDMVHLKAMEACEAAHNGRVRAEVDKVAIILPLYLYDHSGITMSTGAFSCPWDSGHVGWIYVTLGDIRKEYSVKRVTKKIREQAIKCLNGEVETYDEFLTG